MPAHAALRKTTVSSRKLLQIDTPRFPPARWRFSHHSSFGRSEKIAPHGSLSLRACLPGQSAAISCMNVKSFSLGPYYATSSGSLYQARASAFRALDAEHIELADEIAEDDRAVAWASSKPANRAFQDGLESNQLGFVLSLQCGNIV